MSDPPGWGKRGEGYVIVQIILFALIFFAPFLESNSGSWSDPWRPLAIALGLLLALLGGLLALAGVLSLGQNLTAVPYPKEDAFLVKRGPYRIVRHPIYSGIILGAFGWGFFNTSLLALLFAFLLTILFDIKSRREEKWLCEKYPDYSEYQKQTRKLIPFIY